DLHDAPQRRVEDRRAEDERDQDVRDERRRRERVDRDERDDANPHREGDPRKIGPSGNPLRATHARSRYHRITPGRKPQASATRGVAFASRAWRRSTAWTAGALHRLESARARRGLASAITPPMTALPSFAILIVSSAPPLAACAFDAAQ